MQPTLAFAYILAGAGIIAMIAIAPAPVGHFYYAGLILTFMWGYTLIRLFLFGRHWPVGCRSSCMKSLPLASAIRHRIF